MYIARDDIERIDLIEEYEDRIYAAALMYITNGFSVLPVRPGTKAIPNGFNFNSGATSLVQAERWWGPQGKYRGHGLSIPTGPGSVVVIDLDDKEDRKGHKNGVVVFKELTGIDAHECTPLARTPSGGLHILYEWFDGAETSVNKIARGVDIRGGRPGTRTGHALVWPTRVGTDAYQWEAFGAVGGAPEAVRDVILKVASVPMVVNGTSKPARGNENLDDEDSITPYQLIRLLDSIEPDMLEYDEWIKVGMAIKTYVPGPEGLEIFDKWSSRGNRYVSGECHKRWAGFRDTKEVRQGTLRMYAAACQSNTSPAEYQAKVEEDRKETNDEIADAITEFNRKYGVIVVGNKVRILMKRDDFDVNDRFKPSFNILSRGDFLTMTEPQKILIRRGSKVAEAPAALVWLADPRRKDYKGLDMFPGKPREFNGYYNIWRGFAVIPMEGDWSLFKDHILNVVCSKNEDLYEWVLDWMAYGVQHPNKPPGTAIVMRGGEGTGKGTFAKLYGALFGSHYKHITHNSHLVGNFNYHLADAVVVFADEVVYGGDRRTSGVLKALVTEDTITIEQKGVDAIHVRNCSRLIIASNEAWVVPAGATARRWLCLDVSSDKIQNSDYFGALLHQMEKSGGLQAMLHDLMEREITNNISIAPETKMRMEQKQRYIRMDSVASWWYSILMEGKVHITLETKINPGEEDNWPAGAKVTASNMYNSYEQWCLARRLTTENPYIFFNTMVTKLGVIKVKLRGKNYWKFGELQEHIDAYEKYVGHSFDLTETNEEERDDD